MTIMEIVVGRESMRLSAFDKTKVFPMGYSASSLHWKGKNWGSDKTRLEEYQDRQEERFLRKQAKIIRTFMKNANTSQPLERNTHNV